MHDSTHSIFHSAKRFFSGTVLSRISGMVRDMVMAAAFGAQGAVAALMVAFRFSHFFRRVLGEGGLQSAFVPHYEELRKQGGKDKAHLFFRDITIVLGIILILLIALVSLGLGIFYFFVELAPQTHEIIQLLLILMPSLFFICLYGLNAALLQCEKSYFTPSVAPVAFNLTWTLGAIVLWGMKPEVAMPWLAIFIGAGCAAQWIMTIPKTKALIGGNLNIFKRLRNWKEVWTGDVQGIFRPLGLSILGSASTQIGNVLDAIFALCASAEGPALLWYAIRLEQMPISLFGIALSGALLPPLSRAIKNHNIEQYQHFLKYAVHQSLLLMIPITALFLISGDSIVSLIYGHGGFDERSVIETTKCLWAYSFGIIPISLILLIAPAFYALQEFRIPTVATAIAVIIGIILNSLFVFVIGLGPVSIALTTSITTWVNLIIINYFLKKKLRMDQSPIIAQNVMVITSATLLSMVMVYGMDVWYFEGNNAIAILAGKVPTIPRDFLGQLVRLSVQLMTFSVPIIILWVWETNRGKGIKNEQTTEGE